MSLDNNEFSIREYDPKNVIIDKIPDTLQFTNPGDKKLTFNFKTNEDNQI